MLSDNINFSVAVVIPTLNAENYLDQQLQSLSLQTHQPSEIWVIDSESTDQTRSIAEKWNVNFIAIDRATFDHGATRNYGLKQTNADLVLFLSQDALPTPSLIENLCAVFATDSAVAAAYARQIPYDTACITEKLTRRFNYPSESYIRTFQDKETLGIKTFFLSDVCSIYRRTVFDEVGGFHSPILTNEDMLMAATLLSDGYKIAYQSKAEVFHSHNFTLREHYKRNFDIGAFLTMYASTFQVESETGEGIKMAKLIACELMKKFKLGTLLKWFMICLAKYCGNRAGHHYTSYSLNAILKRSNNKNYWIRHFQSSDPS